MSTITKEARVDEELAGEGFEMGQRVFLPDLKQEGTITGMTDLTVEGQSWGFRWPGVYRRINVTLDDGTEVREPVKRVKIAFSPPEHSGKQVTDCQQLMKFLA